jgi:hypothetical protein
MFGLLLQMAIAVATTHGVRALGLRVGPRRGGLLMGLPSTTALVLVGFGLREGVSEATIASEACLASLLAAAAVPLAYAKAASAGWRWPAASAAALGGYTATAGALWWLPATGAGGCAAVAMIGLALACHLAGRVPVGAAQVAGVDRPARPAGGGASFTCRTAVPVVYFSAIQTLRWIAGAAVSGRFITFPGASLTVLATTHMESGPANACRVASGMPFGGLAMLAFLSTFRFGCPRLGLAGATLLGYAAAVVVLAAIGQSNRWEGAGARLAAIRRPLLLRRWSRQAVRERLLARRGVRTRFHRSASPRGWRSLANRRGFAPRLELLTG